MALGAFGLTTNGTSSDLTITGPGTTICTPVTGLTGMTSLRLWYKFYYGSGGTSVRAYKQVSIDSGNTWIDIACRLFTNANATGYLAFTAGSVTTEYTPTDGALADNTAVNSVLGDRSRYKVVVVGTYAGNTLFSARMVAA